MDWTRVAALSELPSGTMKCVELAGESVAIYHLDDGSLWATDAICSHQYALLTDGILEGIGRVPLACSPVRRQDRQGVV